MLWYKPGRNIAIRKHGYVWTAAWITLEWIHSFRVVIAQQNERWSFVVVAYMCRINALYVTCADSVTDAVTKKVWFHFRFYLSPTDDGTLVRFSCRKKMKADRSKNRMGEDSACFNLIFDFRLSLALSPALSAWKETFLQQERGVEKGKRKRVRAFELAFLSDSSFASEYVKNCISHIRLNSINFLPLLPLLLLLLPLSLT